MAKHRSSVVDTGVIYCGDNIEQLAKLPDGFADLIYIDPPFNSNRNYEVFWGETNDKHSFAGRSAFVEAATRKLARSPDRGRGWSAVTRLVTACVFLSACSGTPASNPATPTPPSPVVVSGSVTNRIDGTPVDGSTIQFSPPVRSAAVVSGHYEIELPAARTYTVTIKGPSHVDHQTSRVDIPVSSQGLDFTVLKWGTGRFNAVYDEGFHDFFNRIARNAEEEPNPAGTRRWLQPPQEIDVVDDGSLSRAVLNDVVSLIGEVDQESLPDMFAGWIGPLPVNVGPAPASKIGRIVVTFIDGDVSHGGMGCAYSCGTVQLIRFAFVDPNRTRDLRKELILHEFFHAAGAFHALQSDYARQHLSVMSSWRPVVTRLADVDRFAMWLLYNPGTVPGNLYPDSNPHRP